MKLSNHSYLDKMNVLLDRSVDYKPKQSVSPTFKKNPLKLPQIKINSTPTNLHKSSVNKIPRQHTENKRKNSNSNVFYADRNRSISHMLSKNSLVASTQADESASRLEVNFKKVQKLKVELVQELQGFNHGNEEIEIGNIRYSLCACIQHGKYTRQFGRQRNMDQQLQLLDQLYKQNDKLVHNFVQIHSEAAELEARVQNNLPKRKLQRK